MAENDGDRYPMRNPKTIQQQGPKVIALSIALPSLQVQISGLLLLGIATYMLHWLAR